MAGEQTAELKAGGEPPSLAAADRLLGAFEADYQRSSPPRVVIAQCTPSSAGTSLQVWQNDSALPRFRCLALSAAPTAPREEGQWQQEEEQEQQWQQHSSVSTPPARDGDEFAELSAASTSETPRPLCRHCHGGI